MNIRQTDEGGGRRPGRARFIELFRAPGGLGARQAEEIHARSRLPSAECRLHSAAMKLVRWTRFTWDLTKLPPLDRALEARYVLRAAAREEETVVTKVIASAFLLDNDWSDYYNSFRDRLHAQLHLAFERESIPALVILHGTRIIAASALSTEVEADSHLISGPCVLTEYRNRGLGSSLLYYSLKQLAHSGLKRSCGVAKDNVPAAKFVYPKFGATAVPWEYETDFAVP